MSRTKVPTRMTVVERVYHQVENQDARDWEAAYVIHCRSDEEPFSRDRASISPDDMWMELNIGWITETFDSNDMLRPPLLYLIYNMEPDEGEGTPLLIAFDGGDDEPNWPGGLIILPGESARFRSPDKVFVSVGGDIDTIQQFKYTVFPR